MIDDYYENYTEFDERIEEFKQSLIKSVKEEHQQEIERLRIENAELQEFKVAKDRIQREHAEALRKIDNEKEEALRNIKQMRLTELIGEYMLTGWCVTDKYEQPPKCDTCSDDRQIHFTSPSGKQLVERCSICGNSVTVYYSEEIECYKFSQRKSEWANKYPLISKYYQRKEDEDNDYFESRRDVYQGEPFAEVNCYRTVFLKEEDCQKYCEWLNNNK